MKHNSRSELSLRIALLCGLFGTVPVAAAADEEVQDAEFLEYLGSWDETDEDWLLFTDAAAEQIAADDKRTDPASKDKESVESDNES